MPADEEKEEGEEEKEEKGKEGEEEDEEEQGWGDEQSRKRREIKGDHGPIWKAIPLPFYNYTCSFWQFNKVQQTIFYRK